MMAERTGTGHKSAANAIEQCLVARGCTVKQLNCFPLMGKMGVKMENCYIPLTTKHPFVWKFAHGAQQIFPGFVHSFVYHKAKKAKTRKRGARKWIVSSVVWINSWMLNAYT